MRRRVSLNTFIESAFVNKGIILLCGFLDVFLNVFLCSEGQCWFGIKVEPKEWDDHNLVEYQSANDQEYEATELEPVEIFFFAVDFENEEEDPDYKGARSIYGRSLCWRRVLGYSNSEAVEEGHRESHWNAQPDQGRVCWVVTESLQGIFQTAVRTEILVLAFDLLEYG